MGDFFRDLIINAIVFTDYTILWYFLALNSGYALLLLMAIPEMWRNWQITTNEDLSRYLTSEALPPISVLVPAYNMEASITDSVQAQLGLRHTQHEVIVINDGSTDQTLQRLKEVFDLYEVPPAFPRRLPTKPVHAFYRSRTRSSLLVIDKENGGKADALNAGISSARFPLVVAVDGDTIITPDALMRLIRPFLIGRKVAAAGGTIRVANGCEIEHARIANARLPTRFLSAIQVPEYLRAFLFGRLGWNRLSGNLIVSGAFGLFQRKYLLDIGGYTTGNVVEDLDLVVRLHKHLRRNKIDYEIPFIPDPVAWTEVPSDIRTLGRQRERWHRGLISTLLHHREMLFNPKYGRIGLITYPFFLFGEMMAPVVEIFGYVVTIAGLSIGAVNVPFALALLFAALGYEMLLTVWAVILEEFTFRVYPSFKDFRRMLGYAFLGPFGYRQLTVVWRLKGFWNALRGLRQWGEMKRHGFGAK